MKQRKGLMAVVGNTLVRHPARVFEALIVVLIPLMLWVVGDRAGGNLAEGEGMSIAIPFCFIIAGLWALWWVLQGRPVELSKGVLWTAPLIAYLGVHAVFLSTAPWRAIPFFGMVFMSWLLYAVVAHAVRQRLLLEIVTGLTLAVVMILGLYVVFLGLPELRGENAILRPVKLDATRAIFGVFKEAPPMIFGWLLTLPFALVGMGLPRLPGHIRIALVGYLLIGFYQVGVAGNSAGYLAALVILLWAPVFLRPQWRLRLRIYGYLLGILVLIAAIYVVGTGLREKVAAARSPQPALVENARWSAAIEAWEHARLFGLGLGALPLAAEGITAQPSGTDALGARQTTLKWLAETGIVGLFLGGLALWGVLGRMTVAWLREPFYPKDHEAEFRHSRGRGESSRSSRSGRRRREHRLKRSTLQKVFLGGIVLGLFGGLVFAQFESSWLMGFPLLLLGVWAGIGERFLVESGQVVCLSRRHGPLRFGGALVACLLAGSTLWFIDGYEANSDVFAAVKALAPYDSDANLAFESPTGVMEARQAAQAAIRSVPENAEAWALVARTFVFEEAIARIPPEEAGRSAADAARRAVEIYPKSGYFHLLLAQGLALAGEEPEAVREAFARAAELAPGNAEVWYEWARFRYLDQGDAAGARELLEQLFQINPGHLGGLKLSRRLDL